ncbi:MAG: FtsW/RodA/SpoVE family cell cycle protein [Chloroflexi bacterium]|nr:FtsW/RodA/SpoVE family cell cycle protein [Chloroflexota bacterium]
MLASRRQETILLALALSFVAVAFAALGLAPAVRLAHWDVAFPLGYIASLGVWAMCAVAGHVLLARRLPHRDPLLFPLVMFLSGWGLALIWRLAPAFGLRQTIWLAISVAGMLLVTYAPGDLRWLRRYRYLWLVAGLGLTALTLIAGVNPSGGGPTLWLGCCGLYFQPSEALKLLFVVYLAAYLAEKGSSTGVVTAPLLAPIILMWTFSIVLLVSQRDLGTGSLIFAVFIALLYLATGQRRYLIIGGLLLIVGASLAYFLFDVVRLRVEAWIDPFADPSGRSFQIVQSLIAVADGGLFGNGFGIGSPTVIPVVHSDFVFAAIVEEWGLIGGLAAIGLVAALVFRGFRAAILARGTFRRLLAGGLAALIGLQSILIVGGVIKALPLTGVTLPFLSYGGSSMLAHFIIIGLLLKLSDDAQSA